VHLLAAEHRTTRHSAPKSFIFVLENIRADEEAPYTHKGQQVRSQQELGAIFAEAGLATHKTSGSRDMPGNFSDVCLWALY